MLLDHVQDYGPGAYGPGAYGPGEYGPGPYLVARISRLYTRHIIERSEHLFLPHITQEIS